MPLFISDDEFQRYSHDASLVAEKADLFIRGLYNQLETVRAEADAASITAEQTCSLLEQKYVSLTAEFSALQSQHSQLSSSVDQRASELQLLQSEKKQLVLQSIEKAGEVEKLTTEATELHKSKRQLMEILEAKDLEISEKNATIKSYLDKIVNLTESGATKEARLGDLGSELTRSQASSARLLQEKELLERHNLWLNEELTSKVDSLIELRKTHGELEADMSAKLADVEKKFNVTCSSLKLNKERVEELESKVASLEKELLSSKDAAGASEEHFTAEISTVTKLVELYKESSGEWSKKAGELEGVIKALETHLNQVENDYKEKLEKEVSARKEAEKEAANLKEKLGTCDADLESCRKESELKHLPLSRFTTDSWPRLVECDYVVENDHMIVPRIPAGISGTALAASLLRDGWNLAKLYAKYQEAVDALQHEQLGRKQTQAVLERVLYEIEEKAGLIMDERAEHERLVEAYSVLDEKLQHSLSEQSALETTIRELKAGLKRQERDCVIAQKETVDLQKQVAALLKECRDVQLRLGSASHDDGDFAITSPEVLLNAESDAENIISERLLTFKDINGLVEQNVQLRSLVRGLSDQIEEKEMGLKEKYEKEFQKHNEETASKVNSVLMRAEEQGRMIESLHSFVAMYKKLYEEEQKRHQPQEAATEWGSKEAILLSERVHETSKVKEHAFERVRSLEEDVAKLRSEIISLRSECDKLGLEAQFAQEKLARFMRDFEHQRDEHNGVIERNIEFSQLIIDYQRKLRESSESLNTAEELSRKLTMEVAILKNEKEILLNSEKRALDEVRCLSERVYRLQASLDTTHGTQEVQEEARSIERKKQEDYVKKIEREWAEAKKELQEERDIVRNLTLERETSMMNALKQVESQGKELADALHSVAAAEARAAIAEARCADLEKIVKSAQMKDSEDAEAGPSSFSDKTLPDVREGIETLRQEVQTSKDHMVQYKSIAEVNESALKHMESAYENLGIEADKVRKSLEAEVQSLRERINELERECNLKTEEAATANAGKEEALVVALSETASLKEDCANKMSQVVVMEAQISALKDDLENEHQRWRSSQANYERQVILQSETIQELMKTSQALASAQEETSELRKVADALKNENNEMKAKWEAEKQSLETSKNEVDKKYGEFNELNKMLHSRIEALQIKLAEKDRGIASGSTSQTLGNEDGLQDVVSYLRRSKAIAETEISLLKQEKLRLQSQLESALKAAESAQASLNAERAISRASLFTEEDFKSLQLQVRELTLLRESNVQLREENRHNFEECQKLREEAQNVRTEIVNLERLLNDRDKEAEAFKKEVEMQKIEKEHLEKRIVELLEKSKDVDEYRRMRESFEQMQVNMREKDVRLEEIKKLVSEKQDATTHLEQDLARSKTELNERDVRINEILQTEASLRTEVERFKRSNVQLRRKLDNLSKEKEELSNEIQVLSKQLEDAKQVKRNLGDAAGELAMKEKEREKDTRIQILEKTLERQREDLKKEKEDRNKDKEKFQKNRKIILDSYESVSQQRAKLVDELEKHKHALKTLHDEVEKLKNGSQSESTPVVQPFTGTPLEDFSGAYFQAVENFERVALPVRIELEASTSTDPSSLGTSSAGATIVQAGPAITQNILPPPPSAAAANVPATKTVEEREKRFTVPKTNVKTARKLVRPSIRKPREQGDVEMSEAGESNIGVKQSSSQNIETQGNLIVPTPSLVRKRPSSSVPSDLQEDVLAPEETSSDMTAPDPKKSKGAETQKEGDEEHSTATLKAPQVSPPPEEMPENVENVHQDVEEPVDAERDELATAGEEFEEPTTDGKNQAELQSDASDVAEENLDKPREAVLSDEQLRYPTEQDVQHIGTESENREEGELVADDVDTEGNAIISNAMEGSGIGDLQPEHATFDNSPAADEPLEVGEIDPSQVLDEEKNDGGEMTEDIVESSDKTDDGTDEVAETDQAPGDSSTAGLEATTSNAVETEQGGSTVTSAVEGKQTSPVTSSSSTTINWQERARLRASIRQAGMLAPSPGRARGRATRARGTRGGRAGRGQAPG
ncbi:nuclear-pore anchor [Olea europaea var. sylvestris]|uniref:nuclear-pore anchor n=1 Tax=Olea europaea var. sylvestris TaxID=158386 RepID=UPI000C1CF56E|nr:nuclear-pore anchor [Olea europaea var. sylvestris]